MSDLVVQEYGSGAETLIAVHGGPAAAGDLAPLAKALGKRWRVLEPYQRGSSSYPLSVSTHIEDLNDVIRERCTSGPVIVLGHSWGAMLSLAYATRYPRVLSGAVLIGCGTFTETARAEFERRRAAQITPVDQAAIEDAKRVDADVDHRLTFGRIMARVHGYDVNEAECPLYLVDRVAHAETWADMIRLLNEGVYPAAFAAIECPVLMLHGDSDPHPGRITYEDLRRYIRQLEYRELSRCGHSPWLEREARGEFFDFLDQWVAARWHAAAQSAD